MGVQPPAVHDMPTTVEPKEPSQDDANSYKRAADTAEKESGGSIRDYFVSVVNERLYWTDALRANFPICGPLHLSLIHDRTRRRSCGWRCSTVDDIGLRLINSFVQRLCRRPGQLAAVYRQDRPSRPLLRVSVRWPLRHRLCGNTLHMYCGYQNNNHLEKGVSGEHAEAGGMAF